MTGAGGADAERPGVKKPAKAVANITDPFSRLMPTRRGFLEGYNAQVAVVTSDQAIAAVQVSQSPNDMAAFTSMVAAAQAAARRLYEETGLDEHTIGVVLADAGSRSDANLAAPGPDRLIAMSKNRDQLTTAREHPTSDPPPWGAVPARRWITASTPWRASPSANGEERLSNPASATSRRSSSGSPDADATPPQANSTWQQQRSAPPA